MIVESKIPVILEVNTLLQQIRSHHVRLNQQRPSLHAMEHRKAPAEAPNCHGTFDQKQGDRQYRRAKQFDCRILRAASVRRWPTDHRGEWF
jgi:hypothetical protein